MASGTITLARTGSGYLQGQILWSSVSNGTAANTSTVTAALQIRRSALNTTTGTFKGTFTVGGTSETISWYGSLPSMEWITIKTITAAVSHNADGNGSCYLYAIVNGPGATTMEGTYVSGSSTVTLDWIPRYASVKSVTDFTDEGNPTITYANPAGEAVDSLQVWISLDGSSIYTARDLPKTGTSFLFSLTESERQNLRANTPNSNSLPVYFHVRTSIGGSTSDDTTKATMRIVNAHPTLSPVVKDTNEATKALTGNSAVLVALHSRASVEIHAEAKKYATIASQRVEHGGVVLTGNGSLSPVTNHPIIFTVTDSRGNTTTQHAENTIIPYINPTCGISNAAPETDGSLELITTGLFYNGSFGKTANSLTVQYRYKASGGSYPESWTTFGTVTKNGNGYTANAKITGLDYQTTYTFQARVIDSLHTDGVSSAEKTIIAKPVFDWGKDDFAFNVPVALNGNRIYQELQTAGWYRCGEIYGPGYYRITLYNVYANHNDTVAVLDVFAVHGSANLVKVGLHCQSSEHTFNQVRLVRDDTAYWRFYLDFHYVPNSQNPVYAVIENALGNVEVYDSFVPVGDDAGGTVSSAIAL